MRILDFVCICYLTIESKFCMRNKLIEGNDICEIERRLLIL